MPTTDTPSVDSIVADHRNALLRHLVALVRDVDGQLPRTTPPWVRDAAALAVLAVLLDEATAKAAPADDAEDLLMSGTATERRCDDCRYLAAEYLADARWLSEAGQAQGNVEVAVDLLAHDLWSVIAELHDQGQS